MSTPDTRPIKEEVKKAADDVRRHAHNVADEVRDQSRGTLSELRDRAERMKERAGDVFDRARDRMCDTGHELRARGCDTVDHLRDFIREKPVPALIGFTALGVAVGFLLHSRSRRHSWLDGEEVSSLFGPLRRRLRSGYEDLRERGADVYEAVHDRLPDHPVDTVMSRARSFAKCLARR